MKKANLILTSTKGMDRSQWLAYRLPQTHVTEFLQAHNVVNYKQAQKLFKSHHWENFNFPCIGGSEVATVLGLDPYKASIEVFYSKVGVKPYEDFDKEVMFWGRELEAQIAEKWQYWEGDRDTMMTNFKAKNKIRKCQRVNAYVRNKKYPWIFVSLDRRIVPYMQKKQSGVLECKTMSGWVAKMWENGLPPQYVVQAQTQMGVCEEVYGEIAYLKDGREFDVLPFDFSDNIFNAVTARTEDFYQKVKAGVVHFVLWSLAVENDLKQEHLHEIDLLAPEPDGSEGYKNYLSARYQQGKDYGKPGGVLELREAQIYDECNRAFKVVELRQNEAANKLKNFMGEATTIDFGAAGKVTWKPNAKGSRTFRVDLKKSTGEATVDAGKMLEASV